MSNAENASIPAGLDRPRLPGRRQRNWRFRPALLSGRGNRFEGTGLGATLTRLTTFFYGQACDNLVRIGANFRTRGLVIEVMGSGNRIEIGDNVRLSGRIGLRGTGLTVRIGDRCDAKRSRIVACQADVAIGRDCLIAAGVHLRTSDLHRIVDRASGTPLNPARPVVVGDGVWLAGEAALLKGARVPDGCVVGFRSVVTKAFDESDCVIAGVPARVIRRGIAWSR